MTYIVVGTAHGSYFEERFTNSTDATEYASAVIDGDLDSDVEVIPWF